MSTKSKIFLIALVNFLITFCLTTSVRAASDCSYANDEAMAKEKSTCLATPGKTWDCALNRCIYSQAAATLKDSQAECQAITDQAQRKSCFDALAMGAAKEEGLGSEDYAKDAAKSAELLGWANLIWGALMGGAESTCMSVTIMKWTGLAATAGDLYNYFFLSDKLKKLQEEYSKKTVADSSYNAQKEAFDYLLKEQETIAKVAKQKNIIYTVAAAGYTAAAGMAIYESAMSLYTQKAECGTKLDGGGMSCAQVMGKTDAEIKEERAQVKDGTSSVTEEPTTMEQLKSNIKSTTATPGEQVKSGLMNAGKDIIQPWNIAREAQIAASKASHSDAKKKFDALPQNTRDTMKFDYQKELKDVEQLEVKVLNTRDQAEKRKLAETLLSRWRDIAEKASAMGESDDAERASKAAQKWAQFLSKSSSSTNEMKRAHYQLFASSKEFIRPLDYQLAVARLKQTNSDLHAYIAFYEWQQETNGQQQSFGHREFILLKENTPQQLFANAHGLKQALITLLQFQVMSEVYAADAGKKIGTLAGNMALGVLKTQALRFALCAVAPRAAMTVSSWLQTPYAVAVMATASAAVNFQLAGVAKKEKSQAEKNAEIIKKLIANFELSQAAFCPDGREDVNKPECYCYTEKGERSKHTNSETCQALWAKDDKNYFAAASAETSANGGCVYLNGKYDLNCNCTKLIDKSSGENACLKTQKVNTGTNQLAVANAGKINTLTGAVSTLANGSNAAAGIDTAALTNNAFTQKSNNDKMSEALNAKLKQANKAPIKLNSEAAAKAWSDGLVPSGDLRNKLMGLSNKPDSSFSGRGALSPKAQEVLQEAMKKTGIQYDGGNGKSSKGQKDDYSYLFDSNSSSTTKKVQNFDEGEKKYNYQDNDINTQGGASLFEIISHRFSTSGMRRLFGEQ